MAKSRINIHEVVHLNVSRIHPSPHAAPSTLYARLKHNKNRFLCLVCVYLFRFFQHKIVGITIYIWNTMIFYSECNAILATQREIFYFYGVTGRKRERNDVRLGIKPHLSADIVMPCNGVCPVRLN